jgi:uncharacterized membrane protein
VPVIGTGGTSMKLDWLSLLTLSAALGSGLIAGVFFAFSSFIMQSFTKLSANQAIAAMNTINVVILNSLFMVVFVGTAAASVVLAVTSFIRWGQPGAVFLLVGGLLYLIGSLVVTGAFNVPLNDVLAAVTPERATPEAWKQYLGPWMLWNHVRTVTSLLASLAFIFALLRP